MRHSGHLPLALLIAAALGCGATEPSGAGRPDFHGPVVEVEAGGQALLLQYRPPRVNSGRIWVGVMAGTRVRHCAGAPATVADIRRGAVVSVWTSHGVLESDPAQTAADTIVIEPARRRTRLGARGLTGVAADEATRVRSCGW